MGLGERVRRWIDPPQEPKADEWVVLTTVALHDGPMVQSALEGAGIGALLHEWTGVPGSLQSRYRVLVRHRDLAIAQEILADLRGR